MIGRIVLIAVLGGTFSGSAAAQEVIRYKSAVVALIEDPQARADFEDRLAARFREHNYDGGPSYDIVPNISRVDDPDFAARLAAAGVQAILMLRPAAVGAGATLESVRSEVSPRVFSNMQAFAKLVSRSGGEDLVAVVHMAIYLIDGESTELVSAGAVWLEEGVETREEGIERLQDLIVANVDNVRPAIREHLGLPPLE